MTKRNENEGRWEPFVGKSIVGKTTEPTDTNIYWLEKFLGRGSFGGVFLADQTQRMATVGGKRIEINKKIAIKLMAASDAAIHEVSSALTIPEHINLVRYFDANDVVIDEERLYVLTMELADGGSLRDLLGQGALSGAETRAIAINIAEGLSHLHSIVKTGSEDERWVHRDLKPENVLKVKKIWKIADFGTAKVLDKGTIPTARWVGSNEYMPPEYCRDNYVSTKWDVWSFGVMLVEMLTGHHPFKANTDGELESKIQREHPDLKGVPTEWMEVVKGCLQKEYTRRWTADELLTALDNILFSGSKSSTGSGSSTKVKSGGTKAGSVTPPRSNNAWWIVTVFLVLGGGGFYLWQNPKALAFLPIPKSSKTPDSKILLSDVSLSSNDTEAVSAVLRAREKHDKQDFQGAMADLSEAIRLKPDFSRPYLSRGGLKANNLGDHRGAISDYSEAIKINRNWGEYSLAVTYFARGYSKEQLREGDWQGVIADNSEAIRLKPDYADAYFNRGNAKKRLGDKLKSKAEYLGAIEDYSEAIRLKNSNIHQAYQGRSSAKASLKDYQGSLADDNEAIRIKPDFVEGYISRAVTKENLGDKQGAVLDYNEAIRLKPDSAHAYSYRGQAKAALGDNKGAIADFSEAIKINKNWGDSSLGNTYNQRGMVNLNLGNNKEALVDFNEAIHLETDFISLAHPYNNRGNVKYNLGDKQGAILDYNEAIRLNPDYGTAYSNRGQTKADLGDKQGALADYREAARLHKQQGEMDDYLDVLNRITQLEKLK